MKDTEQDLFVAAARAVSADHAADLAIKRAKKRHEPVFETRRIAPAVLVTPAPEGTNVFCECPSDEEKKTLLADELPELVVEKVLAFAIYPVERVYRDGHTEFAHETYPIGTWGNIDNYDYMVFADGVVEYGNGEMQSNSERLALLRARLKFEAESK